ncbi:MAG: type II secretion system F family protein [Thermodesulfovibrionales bacterium]|nr:type II secretion system F family protein [Thermodesulfovibrionales bacterium]
MPTYSYKVRNQTGEIISGVIDAPTTDAVAEQLFSKGYTPIRIEAEEEIKSTFEQGWQIFDRVKDEDLIVFSRQLATLVTAGISFIRSLDTLAEQTKSRKLRRIIEEIRKEVEGGSSFSDALAKFPKVFSTLYISMVKVGEEAGVLDDILNRLSSLLEHDATTRARVKAATRYPVIVVISMIIAFLVLTTFVVPKFASLYQSAKVELPFPTQVLIFLNKAIRTYWPLLIASVAGVIFAFRGYIRTPSGRWNLDKFKLRVPIIGSVVEKTVMSRFSRIFSTLYSSGIPMLHALDIVAGTLGNIIIARAVEVIKESVREGKGLAVPMASTMVFPPMVTQMVAVGEETGALEDMLTKVADYYDLEVEYAIKNLSTTLEPVLLVFLAGGILFLALGIFLPIWDMMKVMKR